MDFDETRHDFGEIAESEKAVSHTFGFTNNGDAPLVIYGTASGCGCTAAEYSASPVAPGGRGYVKVTYTAEGNPGRFVKGIRVKSNIPLGETLLTVEGRVIRDDAYSTAGYPRNVNGLRLSSTNILFGNITQGEKACRTISAINGNDDTVTVTFPDGGGRISAEAVPSAAGPGEKVAIKLCFDSSGLWGEEKRGIAMRVESRNGILTDTVWCRANIMEGFDSLECDGMKNPPAIKAETRALNIGERNRGETATGKIKIYNTGKSPLHVRKVECSSPCLSAEVSEQSIAGGKSCFVTVTVDGGKIPETQRLLNERVKIISDDPENPEFQIQITASFR